MRHEPSFLKDILSACRKIESIVAATSEDLFLRDELLPAAVLHQLTVIGEAITRLSLENKFTVLLAGMPAAPCHRNVPLLYAIVETGARHEELPPSAAGAHLRPTQGRG